MAHVHAVYSVHASAAGWPTGCIACKLLQPCGHSSFPLESSCLIRAMLYRGRAQHTTLLPFCVCVHCTFCCKWLRIWLRRYMASSKMLLLACWDMCLHAHCVRICIQVPIPFCKLYRYMSRHHVSVAHFVQMFTRMPCSTHIVCRYDCIGSNSSARAAAVVSVCTTAHICSCSQVTACAAAWSISRSDLGLSAATCFICLVCC